MQIGYRVKACRLIEKMKRQEMYCQKIGLEDVSKYYGTKKEDIGIRKQKKVS